MSVEDLRILPPYFELVEQQIQDGKFSSIKNLLLLRHAARVVANEDTLAQYGVEGLQLTDRGIQEAKLFGNHLAGMDMAKNKKIKFHSSDIKRCRDTLLSIAKGYIEDDQDIVIHEHGMLRGYFVGKNFCEQWMKSIYAGNTEHINEYMNGCSADNVGSLTLKQAADKLVAFCLTLFEEHSDHSIILACTHDIVLTFIVGAFFNPGKITSWTQIPQFLEVVCIQLNAEGDVRIIYRSDQVIIKKKQVQNMKQTYTKFDPLRKISTARNNK